MPLKFKSEAEFQKWKADRVAGKTYNKKPRAPQRHLEDDLQMQCCQYVKMKYPGVILNVDASGLKLSKTQAGRLKAMKSDDHFCDIQIMRARGGYHGLYLELKIDGTELHQKKDPRKWATAHIKDQADTIARLKKEGYYARFCVGYQLFTETVDWYMKLEATK